MIDHNALVGRWPFRDLGEWGTIAHLRSVARELALEEVWTSSLDATFHCETRSANHALQDQIANDPVLRFVPAVFPDSPDAVSELAGLHRQESFRAVRLLPPLPGFEQHGETRRLTLQWLDANGCVAIVPLRVQDDRTRHPGFRCPTWDIVEVLALARNQAKLKFLLCGIRGSDIADHGDSLRALPNTFCDNSLLDSVPGTDRAVECLGASRLVCGTNYPVFYPLAAVLKCRWGGLDADLRA